MDIRDTAKSLLFEKIQETSIYARELISQDSLTPDDILLEGKCLVDYGINSIDYCKIASDITDSMNVSVPLDVFSKTNNIREIIDLITHINQTNNAQQLS